jgi:hypothetical protein
MSVAGEQLMPCLPGILYYGNKNGAKVNPDIIPVYNGTAGEFAIFEEHRYPMPFAMLESAADGYAVALHSVPSPVRGAVLSDQWWSMGVEAKEGHSDIVLYSGPIGYNGQHSVAKALQKRPMKRIIDPLTQMGCRIESEYENNCLPLEIYGGKLRAIHYSSSVASAQVKSCVLLAGLYADGPTTFFEPYPSRNHTELMLAAFGGNVKAKVDPLTMQPGAIIYPGTALRGQKLRIPGDISSAAYFIAA